MVQFCVRLNDVDNVMLLYKFCFGFRESNEDAVRLLSEMNLESSEVVPSMRMYRNGQPQQDIGERVFAVTSCEICGF